ncbi:hypothetical protein ACVWXM_006233 [Bradyrhizobium sp. GM7.3]
MPLDAKKLRHDAQRIHEARAGTTKAIRGALPAIYQLRKDGVSWSAIAKALAEQGVVQGKDGTPLTTNRLTGLVSQIEAQEHKKALKTGRERGDTQKRQEERPHRLTLSPDLVGPAAVSDVQPHSTEDELRQSAFAKLQTVLKKD